MNKLAHRLISLLIAFALTWGSYSSASAAAAPDTQTLEHHSAQLTSQTYYVSATGRDTSPGTLTAPFRTFAKAVSVLRAGDTLQILAGTYYETLALSKSGTATAPITVIGNGAILDMQGSKQIGIKISGSHLKVSNFRVTRATGFGIYISGKYVTVENNILHDNVTENGIGTCGLAASWGSALKVKLGGENTTIRGNTVYNNCGEGIAVTRGVTTLVENNTVYDNFAQNIYVDNSPYTTVQNNVSYCTGTHLRLDGTRATGIGLGEEYYSGWGAQMHDIVVAGNTVRDCGKGIGAFASQVGGTFRNVTITQNSVLSGQARAISSSTSPNQNVVISYNRLFNNIYLSDSVGVTLIGNIIGAASPTSTIISSPTSTILVPTSTPASTLPATITATNIVASPTATLAPAWTFTPSSAPNTPTIAPTATLAFTPSPIASKTPTASTVDSLFADGFESGQLSAWTTNVNAAGELIASLSAALVGSNGLQAVINDSTAMYVRDDSPNAEPRYRARFYFDPNSIAMANGDYTYILQGHMESRTSSILRIEFKNNNGVNQVRARALDNGGAWQSTPYVSLTDAPHYLELDWMASTGAGANDGRLTFWVDGVQTGSVTNIANDVYRMDSVRLGLPYLSITSTTGTLYFDNFESRRQTYIGP